MMMSMLLFFFFFSLFLGVKLASSDVQQLLASDCEGFKTAADRH